MSIHISLGWWVGIDAGGGKSNVSERLFAFSRVGKIQLRLFILSKSALFYFSIISLHVTYNDMSSSPTKGGYAIISSVIESYLSFIDRIDAVSSSNSSPCSVFESKDI